MRHIYREVIQVDDQWHERTLRGPILHVATRHEDAIEFWHLHDTDQPVTKHAFRVVGTGHQMAPALALYVGSAITPSGTFVWHLMEHERLRQAPWTGEQTDTDAAKLIGEAIQAGECGQVPCEHAPDGGNHPGVGRG